MNGQTHEQYGGEPQVGGGQFSKYTQDLKAKYGDRVEGEQSVTFPEQTFSLAPAGFYEATVWGFKRLGKVTTAWGEEREEVQFSFSLDITDENGIPYMVFARYALKMGDRANLTLFREAVLGRKLTYDEQRQFESGDYLDKRVMLKLVHNSKGEKTYCNVAQVLPVVKANQAEQQAGAQAKKPVYQTENPPPEGDDLPF